MSQFKYHTTEEAAIAQRAVETYRALQKKNTAMIELMKTMKFPYGSIVVYHTYNKIKSEVSPDHVIGKIIGYVQGSDSYQLYVNDTLPFILVDEDRLEIYDGYLKPHLKHYTPEPVGMNVDLRGIVIPEKSAPYEEIKLHLNTSVEAAVNHLLRLHSEGRRVTTKFNDIRLYSDTVTMDDAHLKITGLTKAQFDAHLSPTAKKEEL